MFIVYISRIQWRQVWLMQDPKKALHMCQSARVCLYDATTAKIELWRCEGSLSGSHTSTYSSLPARPDIHHSRFFIFVHVSLYRQFINGSRSACWWRPNIYWTQLKLRKTRSILVETLFPGGCSYEHAGPL